MPWDGVIGDQFVLRSPATARSIILLAPATPLLMAHIVACAWGGVINFIRFTARIPLDQAGWRRGGFRFGATFLKKTLPPSRQV